MEAEYGDRLTKKEKRALARERKFEERRKQLLYKRAKKFVAWIVSASIVGFILFKVINPGNSGDPKPQVSGESVNASLSDWSRGPENARVTLLEYADFQCPACAVYASMIKKLQDEYPTEVKYVYRHFPLNQIHQNSLFSAKASEAAGKLGKFWEMYDILYQKQSEWSGEKNPFDKFFGYAQGLGLDPNKFEEFYN